MTSVPHSGAKSVTPGGSVAGHTPGPWKIDFGHPRGNPCGISAVNDGRLVTRFGVFARPSTPEALANARLIAAAPDLLEALKAITTDCSQIWSAAEFPALQQAREAIAKATAGETRNAEPIHRRDGDAS